MTMLLAEIGPNILTMLENFGDMLCYHPESPMLFSSGLFWLLFILFLPAYVALRSRTKQMMLYVVCFSLFFYYKSSGLFFLLIIATSFIDWTLSKMIHAEQDKRRRCVWLILSLAVSLSVLGYFKYANFVIWNWDAIIGNNFHPMDIILPVGISFYTFQSISYVVDVYKRKLNPAGSWLEYIFFLSFFPQLVAGPIVRAGHFFPQISNPKEITRESAYEGVWQVLIGVVKKCIVADYVAQYNDIVFANPTGYSGFEVLMAICGYSIQIYCDFSGYSDMAIGLAKIMGFDLGINFNFPYRAQNLTEFWHRWHISLSTWLRDYVYIPLGGNRCSYTRKMANVMITMLLGGLWHGAAWKFVFWGGMHGMGLVAHKILKPKLDRIEDKWYVRLASWWITITFVSLLWTYFRADNFIEASQMIGSIFTDFDAGVILPFMETRAMWCIIMVLIFAAHFVPKAMYNKLSERFVRSSWFAKFCFFILLVQAVIEFSAKEVQPFIYFQF